MQVPEAERTRQRALSTIPDANSCFIYTAELSGKANGMNIMPSLIVLSVNSNTEALSAVWEHRSIWTAQPHLRFRPSPQSTSRLAQEQGDSTGKSRARDRQPAHHYRQGDQCLLQTATPFTFD
jgi:hypothetical protein